MHAALFVTAGLAMMFVPSVLNNWAGPWEKESLFVAGSTPGATEGSSQDAANSPDSAIKHQQAAERDRQQIEVLARQLASAREDVGTLTARVTALTDARTEAEKALQTAQASAAEQKQRWNKSASEAMPSSVSSHPRARRSKLAKRPQMLRTLPRKMPKLRPPSRSRPLSKSASKVKFSPISWHRPERMSEL